MVNMGLPSPYLTILFPNRPPQHPEYLDLRGVPPAELARWKGRMSWFLKCLTLREHKRIVLKTPFHTARIRTLLAMFPKARFVHVVRDPYIIFSSTLHTWQQLYHFEGVQVPHYAGLEEYVLDTFVRMYEAFEEDIQDVPTSQFCEVRYEDLVRDMAGEVRRIYDSLGLDGFEQVAPAVAAYVAKRANYQPNRYQIPPERREQVTTRWRRYAEKYLYRQPSTSDDAAPVGQVPG